MNIDPIAMSIAASCQDSRYPGDSRDSRDSGDSNVGDPTAALVVGGDDRRIEPLPQPTPDLTADTRSSGKAAVAALGADDNPDPQQMSISRSRATMNAPSSSSTRTVSGYQYRYRSAYVYSGGGSRGTVTVAVRSKLRPRPPLTMAVPPAAVGGPTAAQRLQADALRWRDLQVSLDQLLRDVQLSRSARHHASLA